jgi:hypothetical protein
MEKIMFEDATLTSQAKVTIDGVDHLVTEAEYSGGTDLNARTFNLLQDNVENAITQLQDNVEEAIEESKLEEYSASEQRIGTFLGKPLYRKVIESTTPSSANDSKWIQFANIQNLKDIFKINGRVATTNSLIERYPLPFITSYNNSIQSVLFYYNVDNGNIYIKVNGAGADWFYSKPFIAIIEYTKTTD